MTEDSSQIPPPSRPGRSEPWRKQKMLQRVPAHLGESQSEGVPAWLAIAGVALLIIVVCVVLYIMIGRTPGFALLGIGSSPTPTRTIRPPTPPITIVPITLPPPTPTAGPTAAVIKYKIRPGDTLSGIADRYHVPVRAIMQANNLKDETIRIGDDLVIPLPTPTPPGGASTPASGVTPTPFAQVESPPSPAEPAASSGVIRHTVSRGDTLSSIAALYGSTVNAIRIASQLDSDTLSIGQSLMVPIGATSTTIPTGGGIIPAAPVSQFSYTAPSLKFPPENYAFRGNKDVPVLEWLSPAILKSNEFFVVHVEYVSNGSRKPYSITVKQGTSAKLDPSQYYPGADASGTSYSWYVVIISQNSGGQMAAQSPPSGTRTFVWY